MGRNRNRIKWKGKKEKDMDKNGLKSGMLEVRDLAKSQNQGSKS